MTVDSGIVTADSGGRAKIGHDQSESSVTFDRNRRSRSIGISGHVRPEYAVPLRTPLERVFQVIFKIADDDLSHVPHLS